MTRERLVVALSGAAGFLGRALVPRLEAARHTVIALPRALGALPAVDAVVHLGGESIGGIWTARKRREILESRVEGTRRFVERMGELPHPPRVFVCASAAGFYGHRPGEVLDEEAAPGRGFRSEVCLAGEEEARRAEAMGVRTVVLRLGTVLDPVGGTLAALLPFLRLGLCFILGRGADRFSWISREDALRLVEFCLLHDSVAGPVNATAPRSATQKELALALAGAVGRHVLGRLPRRLLRLAPGELARAFIDSQDVRPRKALEGGFQFRHPDIASLIGSIDREPRRRHALA